MIFNRLKKGFILSCCTALFLASGSLFAQASVSKPQLSAQQPKDYSEEELQKYADVTKEVMNVQEQSQQKMMGAIQESGMDPQTFNEMAQSQQMQAGEESQYSEEEQAAFQKAMQEVMTIQQSSNQEMQNAVEKSGMDVQQYQEMAMAINQSPEMQQKVQEMME